MNNVEIAEIRKLYTPKNMSVDRIVGAYIDGEKNIKSTFNKTFLNLPENEIFKYMGILKKGFSGKSGKNINTSEYMINQEGEGTRHDALVKLRNTGLSDEEVLHSFYEMVIDTYEYVGNYLILLIHNVYDVPKKGSDEFKNMDDSDEVYEYISMYICPVELEKPSLCFMDAENDFVCKDTRWCVEKPVYSFIFPSFEERTADIHHVTVYTKKTDGSLDMFTKELLGLEPVTAADVQKDIFTAALTTALEESDAPLQKVADMQKCLIDKVKEQKIKYISSNDLKYVAEECGFTDKETQCLVTQIKENVDTSKKDTFSITNIVDAKILKMKTPDVEIKVNTDLQMDIKTQMVDSRNYIMIPVTSEADIEVNGVHFGKDE